jgi:prevent-host-death family protein
MVDRWPLQDAKARFSELVRRARSDGPQHVTVHGREEVVIVSADEYRRLKGERTGAALIAALQACPDPDFAFGSAGERSPVRDVEL